jgi:membrane-associated phospholipid phosphatase
MGKTLLDWGILVVLYLQSLGAALTAPMQAFTFLGNEMFFLAVAPAIYWCLDTALGLRLGLLLMISAGLNGAIKLVFHTPRPYWYDPRVQALSSESSFGVPSGHSQHAVVVWGRLASGIRKAWGWIAAVALAFFIGLSRIYLGVHFPTDVLAGWSVGLLILAAALKWEQPLVKWLRRSGSTGQLAAALGVSLGLILLGWAARLSLGSWTFPVEWADHIRITLPNSELPDPLNLDGLISNGGAFFGLAAGAILLGKWGGYQARGAWWQRVVRYLIGLAGVLALWLGLDMIFPGSQDLVGAALRYLRYALVGMWVTGLAPLVFIRLRLASSQ